MSRTGTVTILLGIVVLVLGFVIIAGYYDARGQAEAASGFEALGILWLVASGSDGDSVRVETTLSNAIRSLAV